MSKIIRSGIDLYDGSNLSIWFDRTNDEESDGVVIMGMVLPPTQMTTEQV